MTERPSRLAASARFLVEPSFSDGVDELLDTLEILTGRGYRIILAHPERIPAIQEMAATRRSKPGGQRIRAPSGKLV